MAGTAAKARSRDADVSARASRRGATEAIQGVAHDDAVVVHPVAGHDDEVQIERAARSGDDEGARSQDFESLAVLERGPELREELRLHPCVLDRRARAVDGTAV